MAYYSVKKITQLRIFTQQMVVMLRNGVQLAQVLEIQRRELPDSPLKDALHAIHQDVISGIPFHVALKRHPRLFPDEYIKGVEAAMVSERLAEALQPLLQLVEQHAWVRNKLAAMMIYPIVLAIIATVMFFGLGLYVLPRFSALYNTYKTPLPTLSTMVYENAQWIVNHWLMAFIYTGSFILLYWFVLRMLRGRLFMARYKLKYFPLLSPIWRTQALHQMLRTTSSILKGSTDVSFAFTVAGDTSINKYISSCLKAVAKDISHGVSIPDALNRHPPFQGAIHGLLAIGVASGSFREMLTAAADYQKELMEYYVDRALGLVTPLAFLLIGVVIGALLMAGFQPIYNLPDVIKGAIR